MTSHDDHTPLQPPPPLVEEQRGLGTDLLLFGGGVVIGGTGNGFFQEAGKDLYGWTKEQITGGGNAEPSQPSGTDTEP
jgi:hypothetical protein